MASRYPIIENSDYCFYPRNIIKEDGTRLRVPCGRCNGCLLHRANIWAMRLGNEIESVGNAIFTTFTYSNKYLPKLYRCEVGLGVYQWFSDHPDNIRFDGVKDVPREDGIVIDSSYPPQVITNWNGDNICYSSKRDFQLLLKSVRKDISLRYGASKIRYFAVSEYGPTTHRAHIHAIFFSPSREIGEYLLDECLFKYWQMQDYSKWRDNSHFCDSGARGYLTQYLTSSANDLPVHKEESIKPFRLSSKSPAIGYSGFVKSEISEKISIGVNTYTKSISRLNERYLLEYPKDYLSSCWPKCYRFSELSFDRLLEIYGALFNDSRRRSGKPSLIGFRRLRTFMHPMSYNASLKCLNYCLEFGCHPFHYLYLLDMFYYKYDMKLLSSWYSDLSSSWNFRSLFQYVNFIDWYWQLRNGSLSDGQYIMLDWLCQSVGFTIEDLKSYHVTYEDLAFKANHLYMSNVDDIVSNMVKTSKIYELEGSSPTVNF